MFRTSRGEWWTLINLGTSFYTTLADRDQCRVYRGFCLITVLYLKTCVRIHDTARYIKTEGIENFASTRAQRANTKALEKTFFLFPSLLKPPPRKQPCSDAETEKQFLTCSRRVSINSKPFDRDVCLFAWNTISIFVCPAVIWNISRFRRISSSRPLKLNTSPNVPHCALWTGQ